MNNKIALFPGSFDPITKGHESIVDRASSLFEKIIIAIGENSEKKSFYTIEERVKWINLVFDNNPKVSIEIYSGLTVDFCRKRNVKYILRGLRTSADFEFERSIGQMNKMMMPDIETVFLLTEPLLTPVSSSIVRDIIKNGGDISQFVPEKISNLL